MAALIQTLVGIIRGDPRSRAKLELAHIAMRGKLEYDTLYGRVLSPYQVVDGLDVEVLDSDPKVTAGLAIAVQQMLVHTFIAGYVPQTVPIERQEAEQKVREQEEGAVEKAVRYFARGSGINQNQYRERARGLLAECARRHP